MGDPAPALAGGTAAPGSVADGGFTATELAGDAPLPVEPTETAGVAVQGQDAEMQDMTHEYSWGCCAHVWLAKCR